MNKLILFCRQQGFFTAAIAFVCVAFFGASCLFGNALMFDYFGYPLALNWLNGQYWRLLTPIFMHFSLLHLIGNLCWWFYLGRQIELQQGFITLLSLTLISGLVSNFAEFNVSNSPYFGGLSGVVFAVIGYVWSFGKITQSKTLYLPNELFILSLIWLILGYFDVFGQMANAAHLSGLILGLAFGSSRALFLKK